MNTIIRYFRRELLFIVAPLFLGLSCNKNGTKPCSAVAYSFAVTSQFLPQQDVYHIGDTIFLISTFPKLLTDQINTSIIVDYSNSVAINGDIAISYLDTVTHQPLPARDSFIVVSLNGQFAERNNNNQESGINFYYDENPQSYDFKGGFICKKKGIYSMGISDLISEGLKGENCTNAGFNMTVTNSDKHLYFHSYALNVDPNDPYLQQKGYDFRVQ